MKRANLIAWIGIGLAVVSCAVALSLWSEHPDLLDPQVAAETFGPHRHTRAGTLS